MDGIFFEEAQLELPTADYYFIGVVNSDHWSIIWQSVTAAFQYTHVHKTSIWYTCCIFSKLLLLFLHFPDSALLRINCNASVTIFSRLETVYTCLCQTAKAVFLFALHHTVNIYWIALIPQYWFIEGSFSLRIHLASFSIFYHSGDYIAHL